MDAKYDIIGQNYNQTRKADPYLFQRLVANLKPQKEGVYLDIGCGTGNYTHEFAKAGYRFIGIDPSEKMLEKAKQKKTDVEWHQGSAESTSIPSNKLDGIIGVLTIHHWENLILAFQELHRILKHNGRIVLFTSTPKQMEGYWLNHYFPKMMEESIQQMPSLDVLTNAIKLAGLKIISTEPYAIKPDLEDLFLYCGKEHPALYLQKEIRHGISSFSSLANKEEVGAGLQQLQLDMENQHITSIIESYQNDLGDYLFLVTQK